MSAAVDSLFRCDQIDCGFERRSMAGLAISGMCPKCRLGMLRRTEEEPKPEPVPEDPPAPTNPGPAGSLFGLGVLDQPMDPAPSARKRPTRPEGRMVRFVDLGPSATGTTRRYSVNFRTTGMPLGLVTFFGGSGEYIFVPNSNIAFEDTVLSDVAAFLRFVTREHRMGRSMCVQEES